MHNFINILIKYYLSALRLLLRRPYDAYGNYVILRKLNYLYSSDYNTK